MLKKSNYNFSAEKNHKLINERRISFEEIISAIESGDVLDIIKHPNSDKYSSQKMYIVKFNEYAYLVPFITEVDGTTFLKTIIPSRKANQKYLKTGKENER